MDEYFVPAGMGWQRDLSDPRDYTVTCPNAASILLGMGFGTDEAELQDTVVVGVY